MKSTFSGAWGKYPVDDSLYTSKDFLPYDIHKPDAPIFGRRVSRKGVDFVTNSHPYYTLSEVYEEYPMTRQRSCLINGRQVPRELVRGTSSKNELVGMTYPDVRSKDVRCGAPSSIDEGRISTARGLEFDLPIQSDPCPFGYTKVRRGNKTTCVRQQYPVDQDLSTKLYSKERIDSGIPFQMRLDNGFFDGNEVVDTHLALQRERYHNDHTYSTSFSPLLPPSGGIKKEVIGGGPDVGRHVGHGYTHHTHSFEAPGNFLHTTQAQPPPPANISRNVKDVRGGYIVTEADKPCRFSGYSVNPHTNSQVVYQTPYSPDISNRDASGTKKEYKTYVKNPVTAPVYLS